MSSRRDRQRRSDRAAAAAAAAAEDDTGSNNNNNNGDHSAAEHALMEVLEAQLGRAAVNIEKVRIILEACGGDVNLAANLYWDDYLATTNNQQQQQDRGGTNNAQQHDDDDDDEEDDDDDDIDWEDGSARNNDNDHPGDGQEEEEPRDGRPQPIQEEDPPAVDANGNPINNIPVAPRRLDGDFERHGGNRNQGQRSGSNRRSVRFLEAAREQQQEERAAADDQQLLRVIAQARENLERLAARGIYNDAMEVNNDNNVQDGNAGQGGNNPVGGHGPDLQVRAMAERAVQVLAAAQRGFPPAEGAAAAVAVGDLARRAEGSVSVSDDESAGVWKNIMAASSRRDSKEKTGGDREDRDSSEEDGDEDSMGSPRKRRKLNNSDGKASSDRGGKKKKSDKTKDASTGNDQEEGYLSDNDWLWESLASTPRVGIPLTAPTDLLWGLPKNTWEPKKSDKKKEKKKGVGDVLADVEAASSDDDVADVEDGKEESGEEKRRTGIPRTWLNAGFHLSECGTGLVVKSPSEEDLAFFSWQQQASRDSTPRNAQPPPYHCRAITALLSIVTALLYSGTSIQTGVVSASSCRVPFAELDKDARKREFESRLADALSVLLLLAAKSSMARKRRALAKLRMSKDPSDIRKWQRIKRKLDLCPTCSWETDPATGEVRMPEGRHMGDGDIQVTTSYTNANDLRCYVLSNMGSFTSSGGCALFLETIIRIHGKGAVAHMIRQSRKSMMDDHKSPKIEESLVDCTCEARNKKHMEENPPKTYNRMTDIMADTTPPGHGCISVELISLLLTGEVWPSFRGWSTGPLGFGFLSNTAGEIGKGLSRPDRPIWILRGPTCYSLMWLDGSQDNHGTFSKVDIPGAVALLRHWNCWYGQRNKTDFRLVLETVQSSKENRPTDGLEGRTISDEEDDNVTLTLLKKRRAETMKAIQDRSAIDPVDENLVFSEEEIERVQVNDEDKKYYPGKYEMWRYDVGEPVTDENAEDGKPRAQRWVPFYRLNSREKALVETKLGPKIKTILMTRWPHAKVDRFIPEEPPARV